MPHISGGRLSLVVEMTKHIKVRSGAPSDAAAAGTRAVTVTVAGLLAGEGDRRVD